MYKYNKVSSFQMYKYNKVSSFQSLDMLTTVLQFGYTGCFTNTKTVLKYIFAWYSTVVIF